VASGGRNVLPLESDLTVMHPRPNPALDTQNQIAARFGASPESMMVHLQADTPEALVALAHRVDERLASGEARAGGISGSFGLATLLPDPVAAPARLAALAPGEAERVVAAFRAVIADSPFDAKTYEPYAGFLRMLLSPGTPPGLGDLLQYPRLAGTVLPRGEDPVKNVTATGPTEAITLVFVSGPGGDRAARDEAVGAARRALGGLPGATLTGMTVLSYDTEAEVSRELPRLFGLAVVLVVAYLLLHFRSPRDAFLSTLPAAFSFVLLLAAMRVAGQRLNMINLVSLPLLIGINVDYGIFLVSLARSARRAGVDAASARQTIVSELGRGCYAITMCAATTVLGFGSLVTTSVPAVRSLGFVVGVGVIGCLYATLFVLAPLLLMRGRPGQTQAEPREAHVESAAAPAEAALDEGAVTRG
jgi:predicted exporter